LAVEPFTTRDAEYWLRIASFDASVIEGVLVGILPLAITHNFIHQSMAYTKYR